MEELEELGERVKGKSWDGGPRLAAKNRLEQVFTSTEARRADF